MIPALITIWCCVVLYLLLVYVLVPVRETIWPSFIAMMIGTELTGVVILWNLQ